MKLILRLVIFFQIFSLSAQTDSIKIHFEYDGITPVINVKQEFNVIPNSAQDEFFVHGWANAYKDRTTVLTETKLNNRRDELYFAPLNERGWIENLHFYDSLNRRMAFSQLENELYRVIVSRTRERIRFKAEYSIHLPNNDFTSYGIDKNGNILMKYFFLQPAIRTGDEITPQQFKDFESLSGNSTHYTLTADIPENFQVYTDLKIAEKNKFTGDNMQFFQVAVQAPGSTHQVITPNGTVIFGFKLPEEDLIQLYPVVRKQLGYLGEHLGKINEPLFISQKNYRKFKFQGVQDVEIPVLGTYRIFDLSDRLELEMISQLSAAYAEREILVEMRSDHWIRNGIKTYFLMDYIQKNFPDLLLAGNIPDDIHLWKLYPLKMFEASRITMQERTQLFYRLFLTANLDQPVNTPFDELSNLNQTNVSSYKAGLAFEYLSEFLGKEEFERILKDIITEYKGKRITSAIFEQYFREKASKDVSWFFDELLPYEGNYDVKMSKGKRTDDVHNIKIKRTSDLNLPVRISGYEHGKRTYDEWVSHDSKTFTHQVPAGEYDYLVLNDSIGLPDINLKNNYLRPGKLFRRKLKIGLVTDVASNEYTQLFIFPEVEWNNYDKFQLGLTVSNRTVLPQPWIFRIKPQYSTGESALTGSFSTNYTLYPNSGLFRQIRFSGSTSYQHFDKGLAYKSYGLGTSVVFEKGPRQLVSRSLGMSYQNIDRDLPLNPTFEEIELQNYKLYNLAFQYWHPEMIHEKSALFNFQISNHFSKVYGEFYWRWKFAKNKRLGVRVFGGTFINQNLEYTDHFDFGLDRITDCLLYTSPSPRD